MSKKITKKPSTLLNVLLFVRALFLFPYYLIQEIRYRKAIKNYKRQTGKTMSRRMSRGLQKQYHLTK